MECDGRSMRPDWKIGSLIFMAGFTVEHTGHNLRGESIYRRPMGGNARWASQTEPAAHPFCLKDGVHRLYCSLAAGYTEIPAVKAFNLEACDAERDLEELC